MRLTIDFVFHSASFGVHNMAAVVSQAPSSLIAPQVVAHRAELRGNTHCTKTDAALYIFKT